MAKYNSASREILIYMVGGLVVAGLIGLAWSSEKPSPSSDPAQPNPAQAQP